MDLLSIIDAWAEKTPDAAAFINRENFITYKQLKQESDALAAWLIKTFGNDKTPVAVYGHMQPEMLTCFLGCVKAGHAYIPIDESMPKDRVNKIIMNSGTNLILSPTAIPQFAACRDLMMVDKIRLAAILAEFANVQPNPDFRVTESDNYYILYTSGSTGEPKGVQITLGCLVSFISWIADDYKALNGEVYLNQAPFSFDLSVMDLYPCLVNGGSLWSVDKEMVAKPRDLFESFRVSNINIWVSTPSFVEMCLMDKSFSEELLPEIRTFLFCGEILTNQCASKLSQRFPSAKIFNTFGPTEATVAVTSIAITQEILDENVSLPVGYCKSDCQIVITDENNSPLPEGEKGEIVIVGPSVSPGYFGNPDLTKRVFYNFQGSKAYKTGDLGYIKNGLLFYSGRIDFQIKLHGYRIELEDIEQNLRTLPLVKNAVVAPVIKQGKCEYLTAFVVLHEQPKDKEFEIVIQIRKQLGGKLPAYMVPRKIVFKNNIPMTPNGKADRKLLLSEVQ